MGLRENKNNSHAFPDQESDPTLRIGGFLTSGFRGNRSFSSIPSILVFEGSILLDLNYLDSFISDYGFKSFLIDFFDLDCRIPVVLNSNKPYDDIRFSVVNVNLDFIDVSIFEPVKSYKSISWSQFFAYHPDHTLKLLISLLRDNKGHLSFIERDSDPIGGSPDSFFGGGRGE